MSVKHKPYKPKAIRGQKYKGHIKISISQVKKLFKDGQSFDGFIVGNKVNSFHFFKGWHLAYPFESYSFESYSFVGFEARVSSFLRNLDPELGNRVAIYLKQNVSKKENIQD
jgi:hypothetical protein